MILIKTMILKEQEKEKKIFYGALMIDVVLTIKCLIFTEQWHASSYYLCND